MGGWITEKFAQTESNITFRLLSSIFLKLPKLLTFHILHQNKSCLSIIYTRVVTTLVWIMDKQLLF